MLLACEDDLTDEEAAVWFRTYYDRRLGLAFHRHEDVWLRQLTRARDSVLRPRLDPVPYDAPHFVNAALRHTARGCVTTRSNWRITPATSQSVGAPATATRGTFRDPLLAQRLAMMAAQVLPPVTPPRR